MARAALLERLRRAPVVWRVATVRDVVVESARARTVVLDVPDWPGHRAGQHVDIRLTADDGYQAERSYSIASAPELDHLELTIELVDEGEVSPWFVDEVGAGDQFELRGPIGGHFTWSVDEGGPLLLVGGGSGLVPLMAMLRHRAARGSDVEAHALVSVRSPEDRLYTHELALLSDSPGLSLTYTYTRSAPEGWDVHRRRVDADMLVEVGPAPSAKPRAFVCGPTPFVESVADLLVAAGHHPRSIRAERFGPTGTGG
jgi:ferredoxin-NADP reductase